MPSSADIVATAREYLGTPFHHQGRIKGVGIDCAGLLVCVARDLGLNPIDFTNYDHEPSPQQLRAGLTAQLDPVMRGEGRPGNIALMALGGLNRTRPTHVGILTEIGIIHAYAPAHKVVETAIDAALRAAIVQVYRWPS